MRHPIIEAFRYCSGEMEKRKPAHTSDPTSWAIALSMDRYLNNLFDQLAAINETDGRREVTGGQVVAICDALGLPRPAKTRSTYDYDEFCAFVTSVGPADPRSPIRTVSLDTVIESMIRKDECQWRMLEAVNKRAAMMEESKRGSGNKRSSKLPLMDTTSVNKRPPMVKTRSSKSISGENIPVQLREVQIENLIREVIQKEARIEALERFSLALCDRLVDAESANLASKIAQACNAKDRRAKRTRNNSKASHRSVERNRSKSRSVLEETNKALNEKLDRIAGELTGVKSILTQVQPGVEKLEMIAAEEKRKEEQPKEERRASTDSGVQKDKPILKSSSTCLQHASMGDSISDSGCMSGKG